MKKEKLNYNIHDLVTFQIIRKKSKDFLRDLNLPLTYFETGNIKDPDIIINIDKFEPSNQGCILIDHQYHVKENYFYFNSKNIEFEIFGFEKGKKKVNCVLKGFKKDYLFPDKIFQDKFLIPLIEITLLEKNFFLIHGSGVCKKGNGSLLAGRPGSYKSSLTLDFVRRNAYKWLGDDRIIIGDGKLLSFPTSPATFDFKCQYLENENFSGILDKLRYIKYVRKNSAEAKSIGNKSNFDNLIFLNRTNKNGVTKRTISLNNGINMLINNNKAEMMLLDYHKYILAYSFIFPDNLLYELWNQKKDILKENLSNSSIQIIEIPQIYDSNVYNQVCELI